MYTRYILVCVNAYYTCVFKVPSNIFVVKEASVAKPTRVSYLGCLVYACVYITGKKTTDLLEKAFPEGLNRKIVIFRSF